MASRLTQVPASPVIVRAVATVSMTRVIQSIKAHQVAAIVTRFPSVQTRDRCGRLKGSNGRIFGGSFYSLLDDASIP